MALDFPSSPTNGQVYGSYTYSTSRGAWLNTATSTRVVTTSDTPPANPTNGDMWMYTVDGTCFIYYNDGNSSQWVEQSKTVQYPSSYQSPNYIINGALDYWQRATSAVQALNTSGYPSADRYKVISSGASSVAITLARSTDIPLGVGVQYSAAMSWSSNISGGDVMVSQNIENGKYLFAGKTITVSFWAKAATAITAKFDFDQDYSETFFNLTTSWQRFTYTLSLPSTYQSSRPTGAAANDNTELRFIRFTSISSASNTVYFTGLQVEEGSVATAFRRSAPSLQGELAACQRYYTRFGAYGSATYLSTIGQVFSTTLAGWFIPLPVRMRTAPTADFGAAANFAASTASGGSTSACSTIVLSNSNVDTAYINTTWGTAQSITAGNAIPLTMNASAYLGFSAEL